MTTGQRKTTNRALAHRLAVDTDLDVWVTTTGGGCPAIEVFRHADPIVGPHVLIVTPSAPDLPLDEAGRFFNGVAVAEYDFNDDMVRELLSVDAFAASSMTTDQIEAEVVRVLREWRDAASAPAAAQFAGE